MNRELELAFYNRLAACLSLHLYLLTLSSVSVDEIGFVLHSIKQHFSIQLHTHIYICTHKLRVGAEPSRGLVAAEAGVCLSRLLRSRRG